MNVDELRSWAESHRTTLLAGGAGAVALFALYRRKGAAAAATGDADPSGVQSAADNPVDGTAYSSAPYDTYDSIQQQLQALYDQVNAIDDTPVAPAPAGGSVAVPGGGTTPGKVLSPIRYKVVAPSPVMLPPGGLGGGVIPRR